jgi:putative AlgH/UPF0301 family transcriptional regulator
MSGSLQTQAGHLNSSFKRSNLRCIPHELEAGNSMLLSYPGTQLGHSVFLLANVDEAANEYTAFQVNGPRAFQGKSSQPLTLRSVINETINKDIGEEDDIPVFCGGTTDVVRMFIITPHDWQPDLPAINAGPYSIHTSLQALHIIASGDRPARMAMLGGYVQGSLTDFKIALQDNLLGEIVTDEELIFRNYDPETKWLRAMHLHTGGKSLMIPQPYVPTTIVEGAKQETPPRYLM